jgi:hypothetical protein
VLKWAPQTPDAVKSWLRARAVADLAHLDRELAAKPFSLGRSATVVDVSCSGYLFWADQAEIDLRAWPAVVAWLDRIRALPNWAAPDELMSQARPRAAGARDRARCLTQLEHAASWQSARRQAAQTTMSQKAASPRMKVREPL